MKRHPSLVPLSDDHHTALVLARRLRKASPAMEASEIATLSSEVRATFRAELEPHFAIEEKWLFPAIEANGAAPLAERAAEHHVRLRRLVYEEWTSETAGRIGELLKQHVRFEERSLFPKAEEILSDSLLARVYEACTTR